MMKDGQAPAAMKKLASATAPTMESAKMELAFASKVTQVKNVNFLNVLIYVITTGTVEKTVDATASQVSKATLVMNFT